MAKRKLRPDWSAVLIAEAPCGVATIVKAGKDYAEFPGGKQHANDRAPHFTAAREYREEVGRKVDVSKMTLVGEQLMFNPFTHQPFTMYVYHIELTNEEIAKHHVLESLEKERVLILQWSQLTGLGKHFSPFHQHLAEKFGVWKTK
jgi:8-oxo-dGTP pyrophosphatase MutT (NUDIX family)